MLMCERFRVRPRHGLLIGLGSDVLPAGHFEQAVNSPAGAAMMHPDPAPAGQGNSKILAAAKNPKNPQTSVNRC